jgi:hypothetical protein
VSTSDDTALVRVERGTASQEELAALTAVLLARAAAGQPDRHPAGPCRGDARWSRPERRPFYRSPVSWRGAS